LTRDINWKFWIGLLISTLFLYLAFRQVDLAEMWAVIRVANPYYLLLGVFTLLLQYVVRAWRWRILLAPIKETGFWNRLTSTVIGFAANCLLPARLGEFIRANYLGRSEGISGGSVFGTVVVERLFDGFTLLLVLVIGLLHTEFSEEWRPVAGSLRSAGILLFLLYLLLIAFLAGFKIKAKPFLSLLDRLLFFIPSRFRSRLINVVWNFSLGIVLLKSPLNWIQVVFYSLFLWMLGLLQIQVVELSIGIHLPFLTTCLIMGMVSFGVMIPSAPGFIGTFHLTVQYAFLFYGISRATGLSAAVLLHAVFFVPTVLLGTVCFLSLHVPLGQLSEASLKSGPRREGASLEDSQIRSTKSATTNGSTGSPPRDKPKGDIE
jgi:uncharacterized protein (TIRG00374 family)